ncbi:hypothetical protein [Latilactobacillus sakei]|uniref:hypothetical protein n=1 Tax=Latilactobacillus sakei TaxID=1599 RepID=UPI003F52BFE4
MKKIIITLVSTLSLLLILTACGTKKPDYTANTAESALNAGKSIDGKTIQFKVNKLEPPSAFGYNMQTGKHLNITNTDNPKVKVGETVTVKVKTAKSVLGSWIISYTDLKK